MAPVLCNKGLHRMTFENTAVKAKGMRCRACDAESSRRYRESVRTSTAYRVDRRRRNQARRSDPTKVAADAERQRRKAEKRNADARRRYQALAERRRAVAEQDRVLTAQAVREEIEMRDRRIVEMYLFGATATSIAEGMGMTRGTVYAIIQRKRDRFYPKANRNA